MSTAMFNMVSSQTPVITIITPSFNRAELLPYAIESVLAQNYPHIEHVVVDGGSTDHTPEVVMKYPHVRFHSGPDHGMYDAMNKGLEDATGEIIGFLNTDDLYEKNIFQEVAGEFADDSIMAVAGHALVLQGLPPEEARVLEEYSPDAHSLLEDSTIGSNYFNAWFFRRSVFEKIGRFNIDYRIIGDRDFMLRFALGRLKYVTIDKVTYKYYQHADSLTFDKNDAKLEQSSLEHLKMTDSCLHNLALSDLERRLLTRLRTRNSVDLAARSLWKLKTKKFAFYFMDGIRHDSAWIREFLVFGFRSMVKMVSKFKS